MAACSRCAATRARSVALAHAIQPIDLVVVNLYPFRETVARGADYDTTIENIDIGGPAMIRSGAKNHDAVCVVVDPRDYDALLAELDAITARRVSSFARASLGQGLWAYGGL